MGREEAPAGMRPGWAPRLLTLVKVLMAVRERPGSSIYGIAMRARLPYITAYRVAWWALKNGLLEAERTGREARRKGLGLRLTEEGEMFLTALKAITTMLKLY